MKEIIEGFEFEFSKRGKVEFLRITSLSGEWTLTLKQTIQAYSLLKEMWEAGYKEYVHEYAQLNYIQANVAQDIEYSESFVKQYQDYCERVRTVSGIDNAESDEEISKEEIAKQSIIDGTKE